MIALALALLASNPFDQFDNKVPSFTGPAKLIVTWYQSNVTVIDYATAARCEAGRKAVQMEADRRSQQAIAEARSSGGQIIGSSPNGAFCIPG